MHTKEIKRQMHSVTEFLPIEAECLNFINADLIAQKKIIIP